jgi:exonuclease III
MIGQFDSRKFFVLTFLLLASLFTSGSAGTIKLVCWNLLNWPVTSSLQTDTSTRCPYFREVINVMQPSILITEENQDPISTPIFLSQVLNVNSNHYRQGVYIQGPDSNNGIFYLDSLFTFVSNRPIKTTLRDISEFTMIYKPTQDTFRIYAVHLKASSGSTNEAQRAKEVDSLRKVTNLLPVGSDFIVCGDFNFYGDYESAYQKLLQDNPTDDGNFVDPFQMTGTWNNAAYSFYHTQATRLTQFGGGAYGGLNDRFDLILYSNAVANSGGMYYVPGSCQAFGNDGSHYRQSINTGSNSAVSQPVADALYYGSDHLPVMAEFEFGTTPGISELTEINSLMVYPNPVVDALAYSFTTSQSGKFKWCLTSVTGAVMAENSLGIPFTAGENKGVLSLPSYLVSGNYDFLVDTGKMLISKRISVIK